MLPGTFLFTSITRQSLSGRNLLSMFTDYEVSFFHHLDVRGKQFHQTAFFGNSYEQDDHHQQTKMWITSLRYLFLEH